MPSLYWIPDIEGHKELFGSDEGKSFREILSAVFNREDLQASSFGAAWRSSTEEEQKRIREEYIIDLVVDNLEGVCTEEDMQVYPNQKHQILTESIKNEGIKNPLFVVMTEDHPYGAVVEGHHRSGSAKILGMKIVPSFLLLRGQ